MGEALESALSSLRTAITESEAVITHDPLPEVCANQLQLSQVLQNLLSNAIKYRNRDRTPKIHIGVAKMPGEWNSTISETGKVLTGLCEPDFRSVSPAPQAGRSRYRDRIVAVQTYR